MSVVMSEDIQDVIQKADLLIKEGKYKSAWNLLLPYKSDPAARKRLTWLNQQQQQLSQTDKNVSSPAHRGRSRLYVGIALVLILAVGGFAIYRLSQQNAVPSTPTAEGTNLAVVPTTQAEIATANPTIDLSPTDIPPTENGQEVSLQQKLRDWLATVEGVSKILTFDVDVPGDVLPLGYVEVVVNSGFIDTKIPGLIVEKLKTELNTTEFSDLTIILSDGSTTTEFNYDSKAGSWNQTELSSTPKPAD
jgi:hypothetical protein